MKMVPVPRPPRRLLSSLLLVTAGLFGLSAHAHAAAPAKEALDEFSGKKVVPSTVQNKFFVKTNRFEVAPTVGYIPNNSFVSNYVGGAYLAYHFSENISAEGALLYAPNTGLSGVKGLTKTLVAIAYEGNNQTTFKQPLDRLQLGAIFDLRYAPVYGKINLIGESVLNFDVYGTAGAGLLLVTKDYASVNPNFPDSDPNPVVLEENPRTEGNPCLNLGIGMDFFVTQSIALKIDARSELYLAKEPDYGNRDAQGNAVPLDTQLYNTFITTAGVSIFVPKMKPRIFNF